MINLQQIAVQINTLLSHPFHKFCLRYCKINELFTFELPLSMTVSQKNTAALDQPDPSYELQVKIKTSSICCSSNE